MLHSHKERVATFARSHPKEWAQMSAAQHRAIRERERRAKRAAMFAALHGPRFPGNSAYSGANGARAFGRGVTHPNRPRG